MKPEAIRGNHRQSEAISCLSYSRGHQRPSDAISQAAPQVQLRCNQTQSDAIRRNQTQSARPEHCVSVCFVFWAGRKWACVLCYCVLSRQRHNGERACVLCFRVLADPPQNTARGHQETHQKERRKSWAFLLTVKRDTQKERATKSKV